MKARHRRTLFLSVLSVFLTIFLAIIIVPSMLNLKHLRSNFEQVIKNQTGIDAKINGRINMSILQRVYIIAHNVDIPNGNIDSVIFTIPFFKIFNISSAEISGRIYVKALILKFKN